MNVLPYPEAHEPSSSESATVVPPNGTATTTAVQSNGTVTAGDSRITRFRRGFERFRGDSDAYAHGDAQDAESDLELTVLLLREENARLKAERHRPPDVGTMIDQLRRVADERGEEELSDEVWSLLSECLVIREELSQACIEIKAAMTAVQEHLGRVATAATAIQGGSPALPHEAISQARPSHVLGLAPTPEEDLERLPVDGPAVAEQ